MVDNNIATVNFSQTLTLGLIFDDWCRENYISTSPENMIAFLQNNGLLNVDRTIEYLETRS